MRQSVQKPIWRVVFCTGAVASHHLGKSGGFAESGAGADFAGAFRDSSMACAFEIVRLDLFSQSPKRRNGIAVAATSSLARRGILDSGSHLNSWTDKKKVSRAHKTRDPSAIKTSRLHGAADQKMASCSSVTRYVAGRNRPTRLTTSGSWARGIVAPDKKIRGSQIS